MPDRCHFTYADGRLSRQDAVTFAYIAQLILQTLPGVRREISSSLGHQAWQSTLNAVLAAARNAQN